MWAEFAFGTILAICGFLVKRTLDDIDSGQTEMNKRLYHQGERLRAVEKNQALERQALDSIHDELKFLRSNVNKLERSVERHESAVSLKVKDVESMTRKNQESLGKIIIIMKKWILKK